MSEKSKSKYERTPPNAGGDFYVVKDTCLACMAPVSVAPELMGFEEGAGCYFKRQPATPEEVANAVEALGSSCVEALRYSGEDPAILKRLRDRGCKSLCDSPQRNRDV